MAFRTSVRISRGAAAACCQREEACKWDGRCACYETILPQAGLRGFVQVLLARYQGIDGTSIVSALITAQDFRAVEGPKTAIRVSPAADVRCTAAARSPGSGPPRLLQQAVTIDETAVLQRPVPAVRRRRTARLESEASAVTRNGVGTPRSLSGRRSAAPTPPTPLRAAAHKMRRRTHSVQRLTSPNPNRSPPSTH